MSENLNIVVCTEMCAQSAMDSHLDYGWCAVQEGSYIGGSQPAVWVEMLCDCMCTSGCFVQALL